jgi:hypothetical protein
MRWLNTARLLNREKAHFKVAVPSSFYNQAKELAGRNTLDFGDDPEDQAIMELPDNGVVASTDAITDELRDSTDCFPEDATVEVSSTANAQRSWMIISSLRENFIDSGRPLRQTP